MNQFKIGDLVKMQPGILRLYRRHYKINEDTIFIVKKVTYVMCSIVTADGAHVFSEHYHFLKAVQS